MEALTFRVLIKAFLWRNPRIIHESKAVLHAITILAILWSFEIR